MNVTNFTERKHFFIFDNKKIVFKDFETYAFPNH